jgi:hypothetical protein
MSDQLAKATEKSGMKISKDKLIEAIRKSTQKEFLFSQSQGSKSAVVVISL